MSDTTPKNLANFVWQVADPFSLPKKAGYLASRLAAEVLNPRDAGARWCSAVMLRDLSPQILGAQCRS